MDANNSTQQKPSYERPRLHVVGSLHSLTRETGKSFGETDGFYLIETGQGLHSIS